MGCYDIRASMESDAELLARWHRGDELAAAELTRRYYDRVWRFFEVKVPSMAGDLTQQTFLALLEGYERFQGRASFRAYLFGIARHLLMDYLRDRGRMDQAQRFQLAHGPETVTTPSRLVYRCQEQQLVLRALDNLPLDGQVLVQLHYWEGLKPHEIADAIQVPASTISSRLHRARGRMREFLERCVRRPAVLQSVVDGLDAWTRSVAGGDVPSGRDVRR